MSAALASYLSIPGVSTLTETPRQTRYDTEDEIVRGLLLQKWADDGLVPGRNPYARWPVKTDASGAFIAGADNDEGSLFQPRLYTAGSELIRTNQAGINRDYVPMNQNILRTYQDTDTDLAASNTASVTKVFVIRLGTAINTNPILSVVSFTGGERTLFYANQNLSLRLNNKNADDPAGTRNELVTANNVITLNQIEIVWFSTRHVPGDPQQWQVVIGTGAAAPLVSANWLNPLFRGTGTLIGALNTGTPPVMAGDFFEMLSLPHWHGDITDFSAILARTASIYGVGS